MTANRGESASSQKLETANEHARWLGPLARVSDHRLGNGLEVRLVRSSQAPIVVASTWYRVGARDEPEEHGGIAHFLEHMMFKGSERFPTGAIDRITQSLGGENNAFTSHDATAYYFSFSAENWRTALEIEADRMHTLTLAEDEIERERDVILEEITMYDDDPWDALELAANRAYYRNFPYARPILGSRKSVRSIDRRALEGFYRRFYRPDNAVLVLAGNLPANALEEVEERFGSLVPGGRPRLGEAPAFTTPSHLERLHRDQGRSPRLLVLLPAPPVAHADFAAWQLAIAVLGGGRSSRLHRRLVDDGKLCSSMSAGVTEMAGPGVAALSAEPLPGVEPAAVEEAVLEGLEDLQRSPPSAQEVADAKRLLLADWVFGVERIQRQALIAGHAAAVLDAGHPARHLAALLSSTPERVREAAGRQLIRDAGAPGGVAAWSWAEAS